MSHKSQMSQISAMSHVCQSLQLNVIIFNLIGFCPIFLTNCKINGLELPVTSNYL